VTSFFAHLRRGAFWVAGFAAFLLCSPEAAAQRSTALFSLALGYNQSPSKRLQKLKYADDDAVHYHRLMKSIGAQSVLLAQLDAESKELYGGLQPKLPTTATIDAAITALNARVDAAKTSGRKTVLYLFYSGHGDVAGGEGYVQLHGARLTRSKLLALLRRSHADENHVVIDACKSYFLVFKRGPGGRRRAAAGGFLPGDAAVPKNTGFLLSTSSAQDSHEWEAYQAGIFSHEVRSALRGAADVNVDRVVTYQEAAAFIYTANRAVPNRRFRPRFFVRPLKGKTALIDLRGTTGREIIFSSRMRRHYYIEDALGRRLADLHPAGQKIAIVVPRHGKLFVRDARSRIEYVVPDQAKVVLAGLKPQALTSRSRGAEHESFARLFAHPFDHGAITSYRGRPNDAVDDLPAPTVGRWLRPALGVFSLVALATGATFSALAANQRGGVDAFTSNAERQQVNRRIGRYNAIAISAYAAGGAAGAGYLAWTFWPKPKVKVQVSARLSPLGQAELKVRW